MEKKAEVKTKVANKVKEVKAEVVKAKVVKDKKKKKTTTKS